MRIRHLFTPGHIGPYADICLFLFRICIALFMLTHGIPKLEKLIDGGEIKFADPFGIGMAPSLALTVFAEVFCSILILLGLATRLACIPLIITMLVAVFIAHSGMAFEKKELASIYLVIYIILLVFGAGKYSIDSLISKRLNG